MLTKGLIVCWHTIMYNGSHSFVAQLVNFDFLKHYSFFHYLSNCIFQMTYQATLIKIELFPVAILRKAYGEIANRIA